MTQDTNTTLWKFATNAIHIGSEADKETGAVITPLNLSTTYWQEAPGKNKGYEYSRSGNPTRAALERNLAALEHGRFGLAFASGLGAIDCVLRLLKPGDKVIASDDLYGGSRRIFTKAYEKYGIKFVYVDATDVKNIENEVDDSTKMIWLETPTNPLLRLTDLKAVAQLNNLIELKSKNSGYPLIVVDNTFMSPYFQKPLLLGADIVVHSTTKYINGHSDVVGGAIVLNDNDKNENVYKELKFFQNAIGAVPSPFDCWLTLRGIKTLALRMEQHNKNAQKVAEYLSSHKKVKTVNYPGLKSHPQHELAKKQMTGFGGMISIELDGSFEDAVKFASNLKLFALGESLGGVESLIGHPATMTHASVPREHRMKIGLSDTLLRLSVGIEDADDLMKDIEQGLDKV
ncbi:cystathionine gamma-synthase [Candidatus Woesearchaeota archaeon]|nr:cystathionine gamma-synthase [Candidatus Woesearchaeota archaeon]